MAFNEKDQKTHEKALAAAIKAERKRVREAIKFHLAEAKAREDKVEKRHAVTHLTSLKATIATGRQDADSPI